jgi:hypothetical protein
MPKIKRSLVLFIAVPFLIALSTLVTASRPTPPAAECNCTHLEELQRELRNAQRLQQAFRNKIPALQSLPPDQSLIEMQRFSQTDARKGFENPPKPTGESAVDFTAKGDLLYDPSHPTNPTDLTLCDMAPSFKVALEKAVANAACAGIGEALKAHEEVHHKSCVRRGYVPFFKMKGAERAQDEVDAYGEQIKVLRAEIIKVLEHAQVTVITDVKTVILMPKNPLYTTLKLDNNAEIQTTRVSGTADRFRFDGQGTQANNASVDGNCRMSGGVPYNLPAQVSIDTDGITADVSYETMGTMPSISMKCSIPGAGEGYGMSVPVQMNRGKVPLTKMPLKDGSEVVIDMAQSEAAKLMAGAGATVTGKATIRLVCK